MSGRQNQDLPPEASEIEAEEQQLPLPEVEEAGEAAPESLQSGAAAIREFQAKLPNAPGVYRMIGADGEVLYVGKARSLKKRVASYTRGQGHSNRIERMIAATRSMAFVTTETESEALLLETNYIKQLKPRFNVLMRDDKSFPYILITGDHAAPQIAKHRGARNRKGEYYGPFASAGAVGRTINTLQRAFLLRSCSDSYYENRTRPCLLFQIKRCAGPCTGEISGAEYEALVGEAKDFLTGRSQLVKQRLSSEMQAAAADMEFERAARYRDRLAALSAIQSSQDINPRETEEADVFACAEQAGQFCVEAFFFRTYQNWGSRAYFPKADRSLAPAEVLDAFLTQFYDDKPCPKLILLSHETENMALMGEAFSARAARKVELHVPRRGEKRDLVDHALRNAKEELARRLSDTASQEKLLTALGEAFGLKTPVRRVEVFDNSHIMGTNAVGAMIVAGGQGFVKSQYRTFNFKAENAEPGDDYAMMREMLTRRFQRAAAERAAAAAESPRPVGESEFPSEPGLILVDGGKGQFEAARQVLSGLGLADIPLAGIAKGLDRNAGRETFFIEGRQPFRLAPRDPALYFVQRLRDEAHRFAIGAHRAKRKRSLTKNPLDEIGGIGPSRKRALLLHFGTAKAVSRAGLDDLKRAPGINAATAQLVYDFFQKT